jgi:hypothetical protein
MSSGGNVRTFGADVGMDFRPQAGSNRCQGNAALGVAANYPSGLVTYEAGQTYTLAWPPKNHAAATCTNQFIPDTFLRLYMAPYDQAAGDPTQEVFRESQLTASFSDDPHVRNTIDFKGFQNCPRFCDDTDKSLCTGTFQVPENAAPGIYTFQWYWAFNNEADLYATCYEAEILPRNTNPGTPATSTASPGTPSTTLQETTKNPSSVYVNLDFQTSPVGFTTGQTVRVESEALRFETSTANFNNGFLRSTSSVPGEHWGRLWMKMDAVSLTSNLGHWVVVAGGVGNQQIRMVDINSNEAGRVVFQLGWQDDQYQKVTSWANKYPLSTDWVCYEWNMNPTAQTFDFFVNGQAVAWDSPAGIGSNVPAGRSLPTTLDWIGFGAENFGGSSGTPIAGFLDNILVSASRAGCGASPDTTTNTTPDSAGFGSHIEGAALNDAGLLFAVHYRNSDQDNFTGNSAARNTIGVYNPSTQTSSLYYTGEVGATYNGIQFVGTDMYLADVGQGKVRKVNTNDMSATDFCSSARMSSVGVPNDLTITSNGRIYLSGQDWESSTGALWMCTENGAAIELESGMGRTNGVALSPDERTLYLTEAIGSPVPSPIGTQVIWKYTIQNDGTVSGKVNFFDFAIGMVAPEANSDSDGMQTDASGNLYVTRNGEGKVTVISPEGEFLMDLPLSSIDYPTNLALSSRGELYVVGRCGDASWGTGDGCIELLSIDSCVGCCVPSEFLAPGTGAMVSYGLIRNSETVVLPCPTGFTGEFDLMCVNAVSTHSDGYCTPGSASSNLSATGESKDQTGTVVGLALALVFVSIAFALYVAFDRGFLTLEDLNVSPKSSVPKLKRDPEDVKTAPSRNSGTKTPEIDSWYYVQDGKSVGPVKESTLIAHLKSLPQDSALSTQVWNGSTVLEWRQVSEVASLARSLRTMWIPN